MKYLGIALGAFLVSGALFAQSLTGTYSGTYSVTYPLPTCTNLPSITYSGAMRGILTQSGSNFTGNLLLTGFGLVINENGVCRSEAGAADASITITSGKVDKNAVSGNFILIGVHPTLKGTISGSTVTASTNGGSTGKVTFEITRTTTANPPAVSFGNRRHHASATGDTEIYWSTAGATTVAVSWTSFNGLFGGFIHRPGATNSFVLTATGPTGVTQATTVVKAAMMEDADVVVAVSPLGIVQQTGLPLPSDSFTLRNIGGLPTDITLTTDSALFTVTPSTFTLEAIESQIVTVVATTAEPGSVHGSVAVSGTGVTPGLRIPIHRLVSNAPPVGVVVTADPRRDVSGPAGQNASGVVSFTNSGSSTIDGVVLASVPWIDVPIPDLTLRPGETKQVALSIDPARRPAVIETGAAAGIAFRYVNAVAGAAPIAALVPVSITGATQHNLTDPFPLSNVDSRPKAFASGASRRGSSVSDLSISNRRGERMETSIFFFPQDNSNWRSLLLRETASIPTRSSIFLPNVLKNAFGQSPDSGSLMIQPGALNDVFMAYTQLNTKGGVSTVTALPVFRSDQGYGAGAELFLPGVQKSGAQSTTLYVQEMAGFPASVAIDFFNAQGNLVVPTRTYPLAQYSFLELPDAVPAGATTVRVKNTSPNAVINGYAKIIDPQTSDVLTISQVTPGTGEMMCPNFPYADREMFLYLSNSSADPITVTATATTVDTGRRRAVTHSSISNPVQPDADTSVTLPGFGSRRLLVNTGGVVRITGSAAVRAAATMTVPRSAGARSGGDLGRVGSGASCVWTSQALTVAKSLRFAGIEDSPASSRALGRPLTFRTDLAMREVSGRNTRVHLTLRYTLPGGKGDNHAAHSWDQLIPANSGFRYTDLVGDIVNLAVREGLGDLHNASLDIEVVGTANPGSILAFLSTVDMGTGDVTIRVD